MLGVLNVPKKKGKGEKVVKEGKYQENKDDWMRGFYEVVTVWNKEGVSDEWWMMMATRWTLL